jgi:hypothetical protein
MKGKTAMQIKPTPFSLLFCCSGESWYGRAIRLVLWASHLHAIMSIKQWGHLTGRKLLNEKGSYERKIGHSEWPIQHQCDVLLPIGNSWPYLPMKSRNLTTIKLSFTLLTISGLSLLLIPKEAEVGQAATLGVSWWLALSRMLTHKKRRNWSWISSKPSGVQGVQTGALP